MKQFIFALTLTTLLTLSAPAEAAELSLQEWFRDTKLFGAKVIDPFMDHFAEKPCTETLNRYLAFLFAELIELRESISPKSYLLLREILIAIREEFYPLDNNFPCQEMTKSALIKLNIIAKIEMLTNSFILLELDQQSSSALGSPY